MPINQTIALYYSIPILAYIFSVAKRRILQI